MVKKQKDQNGNNRFIENGYYYYLFILCWQDVKIIQLKYLHNRGYTKNSILIKVNKLKLI